jgi:RsiW-degrading membrane proteinase PrsW (M82 family)
VTAWLSYLTGFLPVLLLLTGMVVMDCYKLVSWRSVLRSAAFGGAAAAVAWAVNRIAIDVAGVPAGAVRGAVAPVVEEALKLAWLVVLIRRGRIGFLVDAAIHGFAVGTGFAVIENLYYAGALGQTGILLWLVRGLGTAIMHGGVTAVAGILARDLTERRGSLALRWFVPGYLIAVGVHAAFNLLRFTSLFTTALVVVAVPLILVLVYEHSERQTRDWLGRTMDRDVELLELIHAGTITETPVGHYLGSLRQRFPALVVADMLCLLEIHASLAMRAKGLLIARGAGVEPPADPEVATQFRELRHLERTIGPTGLLALMPFLRSAGRERWQLRVLEAHATGGTPSA